jgi:hypothetical protein
MIKPNLLMFSGSVVGLAAAQRIREYAADRVTSTVVEQLLMRSVQGLAGITQRGRAGFGRGGIPTRSLTS